MMMRFTVLAMILVGACAANGPDTGAGGDDMGGGTGSSGGTGGSGGSGSGTSGGGGGSMLPSDLVGTWEYVEADAGIGYQFTANGGIVYVGDLVTSDGCTYETQTSYNGYVRLQGTILTLTPTDGMQTSDDCGDVTSKPFTKVEVDAYQIQTTPSGPVLDLQNQATGTVLVLTHP